MKLAYDSEQANAIMEEAKLRYPIGTRFKSTYSGSENTVKGHAFYWTTGNGDSVIQNPTGGWLYSHGIWAEIVGEPIVQTQNYFLW